MTGQDLLDRMELFNQELQLQSGEANVTRALVALNVAQDYFESLAALRKVMPGSVTSPVGTVSTSTNTESTAFPAGLLRIDRLQLLDAATNRPKRELEPYRRTGGHAYRAFWPYNILSSSSTGEPRAYWTNGNAIFWDPLPSGAYNVRYYGFVAQPDISASGTFAYPDIVAFPLAAFAVRLYQTGLGDNVQDAGQLAQEAYKSVLDTLENYQRDGASGFEYTQIHNT